MSGDVLVHHIDGARAGHLHRNLAQSYFNLVLYFWNEEGWPLAHGAIERWRGGIGGRLHLPAPDLLARWSLTAPKDRPQLDLTTLRINLRCPGAMKARIPRLAGRGRATTVAGHVRVEATPSGK